MDDATIDLDLGHDSGGWRQGTDTFKVLYT